MSEDKMLESFSTWWNEYGRFYRAGGGQYEETFAYEAWKACAAIKDAEIAELKAVNITTHEKELIACDLMIKELREAGEQVCKKLEHPTDSVTALDMWKLRDALANSEHHNSRALEKKLLEARIESLNCVNRDAALFEYKLQLAELNKE